ncbi:MAG: alanyl-tRNA synthetase [Pseudohongiellaceae bacterium]|jgi:alanyl-tRNA synthetase
MTPDALRAAYLRFFEERGHSLYPSDSLVPQDDPTLLFTGAGMNQFKAMFLGKGNLPFSRATTSQKCLRMPDLENVGRTASHHTFFEMLGNFSFGDYFKEDAIAWAWEFLGTIGLPADRLSVTVYKDDDEAASLWIDGVGIAPERVYRYDEDENFWPASAPSKGPNGLCGPCSEIYFDYHPDRGDYPPEGPEVDGSRFVEIWNLVFTQFDRQDGGTLAPLPQRNIDTGMGFERILRVVQSLEAGSVLPSNFETTLFTPLVDSIHEHIGKRTDFGTPDGERARRIADHVRAATFCITDGVRPSNEKQGYVVRKVLRRAMLDRHQLGGDLRQPWLTELAEVVVDTMGTAWPELSDARQLITSSIAQEEEKFASAFLSGSQRLHVLAQQTRDDGNKALSGEQAFLLYDTFGLPLDMQKQLLEDEGLAVDEEGFRQSMAEQRRRSRESSKISDSIFDEGPLAAVSGSLPETQFVRESLSLEDAQILAVVTDEEGRATSTEDETEAESSQSVVVVLDRTPFYAEGGGQQGDSGVIEGDGFRVEIDGVVSLRGIHLHRGLVTSGKPVAGPARAVVDAAARLSTERNHTATHLLHAALHQVLGNDVTQAGSLVTPDRLRFDFRFPRGLTEAEMLAVEDQVNQRILDNQAVESSEMNRDEARTLGAMALFGEKYGERVRVVAVPGCGEITDSVELCGGTHVTRSGDIGMLRILTESSVASGVRRIEARTGQGVLESLRSNADVLAQAAALLKTTPDDLGERIRSSQSELKELRKQLEALRGRMADIELAAGRREWNGLQILVAPATGVPAKQLRELAGSFQKDGCDLVLLASPDGDSTHFLAAVGDAAQAAGIAANQLVSALATALGGKGGGKRDFAQGRGGPADDLQGLLNRVIEESLEPTR